MTMPHSTEMPSERGTDSTTASAKPGMPASTSNSNSTPSPKSSTDSSKPIFASDSAFPKLNPNASLFTPSSSSSEPFPKICTPQPKESTNTSASDPGVTDNGSGLEEVRGRQDYGFERKYGRRKSAGEIKVEEMCEARLDEERMLRRAHRDSLKAWEERVGSLAAGGGEE